MAETNDPSQRTEEPTPKRLEDARRKGDAPRSQEITAAAMLFAGALALWLFGPSTTTSIARDGAAFLDHPHAFIVDGPALTRLFAAAALSLGAALAGVMGLMMIVALGANIAQARPVFTAEKMKPRLDKLSPIAGAKRIFGPAGLVNFLKGVGKIVIVGVILVFALWPDRTLLGGLVTADAVTFLELSRMTLLKLLGLSALAMSSVAALDYAWQRKEWKKRLRMTREEVRREQKESEGDPQIKGRQRSLRETRARRRMLAAVKDATVLIMNPTHFAVALKYETEAAAAPVCVAKGLDDLALRMRAEADRLGVPVVENPPLARALHASVEIDAEIPVEHYEAVAKVIGFVMARAGGKRG